MNYHEHLKESPHQPDLADDPFGREQHHRRGGDLQAWGAGEGDKINPNAYKSRATP
jgi:hypothetical protein